MSDKPKYTTAIIAAVPHPLDPVNDAVIEDAHVTLQFLGEADTLSDEQIEDIKASLELMASNLYPFPAEVSGTAELGPDKAKVLLVQSEPLTKIRDLLGTVPAVSTAVAAAKQFPNWIPHLTLAYGEDGAQVEAPDIEAVQIGSLELWLGDDIHHVCQLAKTAPGPVEEDIVTASVIAAGLKQFDENLHPRGADGRFIEKFGVIKFLTTQGWAYGKVEGFFSDEGTGQTKITVTPSDLGGKPTGKATIDLNPKQVYRAPKKVAHLTTASKMAQKIGGQGGSNPGGLYTIPTSGPATEPEKFYVKKPKTKSHGANEVLANDLYAEAGVPVPEVDIGSDGQIYSKIVDGKQDMADQLDNAEWVDQVRRNFAVDAWLSNRDVFGMTYDNILTDENGTPWRIDNGGALLYRAMGEKKTDFGAQVTELDAMRQGKKAKIFGSGMTKAQEIDGAERVLAILPNRIEEMVAEAGLPKSLADTLKARRLYIANYYGLPLPESQKAPEAQEGSSAPLVDAPDIAKSKGKPRSWFPMKLHQTQLVLKSGDQIEFPDGSTQTYGVGPDGGQPLSLIGQANQLLDWQNKYGPDAEIMVKKAVSLFMARPSHGQKLKGNDLAAQKWQRGDVVIDSDGVPLKVLAWNGQNGAMLVQFADHQPRLLDTFGADANEVFTVERWDPPAKETLSPEPVEDDLASYTSQPDGSYVPSQSVLSLEELAPAAFADVVTPADAPAQGQDAPESVAPVTGKTGQAAEAEAKIKADLDQPLPAGNGAPAAPKTSAKGGAKEMLIGDGTTAAPGADVVSKKDGKAYKFVKPKGQYAVVTDPNGEDPEKLLLKLASTMTQPGKQPSADTAEMEKPKTATGEVPVLGMLAEAKDGWAGTITMISPDGKFVFITDANGKRKRKSTGAVSVTGGTPTVVDTVEAGQPVQLTGPVKPYGPAPKHAYINIPGAEFSGFLPPESLSAADLVVVGYADGSHGVEPYGGQPEDSLAKNANGKLFAYGQIDAYQGPIAAEQFIAATGAMHNAFNHTVIWAGTIGLTNGKTGPHGGLLIWDPVDATSMQTEIPPTGQIISIVDTSGAAADLPEVTDQSNFIGAADPAPAPLYGEEAKTLDKWKGQISPDQEISLDGETWLTVGHVYESGALMVEDINGQVTNLNPWSSATYVVKAPALKDGEAGPTLSDKLANATGLAVLDALNEAVAKGKIAVSDLSPGDVVLMPNGETEIIKGKDPEGDGDFYVTTWSSPIGETIAGDTLVTKTGNAQAGPIDMEIGQVIDKLYPGAKLNMAPGNGDQVLSYPELLPNGNWQIAVALDSDPDDITLVQVGTGPDAQIGPGAVMGVHLAPSQFPVEFGVDADKLQKLYDDAKTVDTVTPPDHFGEMSEQGLDFGTALYPIYTDGKGGYYRKAPMGAQVWTENPPEWVATSNIVTGMEQVWKGKDPGTLGAKVAEIPGHSPLSWSEHADYKPEAGTAVTAFQYGSELFFAVHPNGDPADAAYLLVGSNQVSPAKLPDDWKTGEKYTNVKVIHDPFGLAGDAADATDAPTVTHHEGPEAPSDLAERLSTLGHTPEPGATYLAVKRPTGAIVVLLKQPDGTYKVTSWNGELKSKAWTLEEIQKTEHSGEGSTFFTWTFVRPGEDGPKPVEGMPSGYSPFVPGEGQSVLKSTLASGLEKVYLQKQPNGGWYLLAPDGTVDEDSDAIKSNHVVQQKLAGKGSAQVKYELLHPKPEGVKASDLAPPTFTNASGDWTPAPGQKVASLSSFPGDNDPWFYVQEAPGEAWKPAPNSAMAGVMSDATMQANLTNASPNVGGSSWQLVYGGEKPDASVDTPIDNGGGPATPTFHGYIPAPDEKVISYTPPTGEPYYYVNKPGEKHWYTIDSDGEVSQFVGIYGDDLPANLGPEFGNDYAQEWPLPDGPEPTSGESGAAPSFGGYTPEPGEIVIREDDGTFWVKSNADDRWHAVQASGKLSQSGLKGATWAELADGKPYTQVWPVEEAAPAAPEPDAAPAFSGYTPKPGEKVMQESNGSHWVFTPGDQTYHPVKDDGTLDLGYGLNTASWGNPPGVTQVWPSAGGAGAAPAGVFDGYQSQPGESVIQISGSTEVKVVKKDGKWWPIVDGAPQEEDAYSQDTMEWANTAGGSLTLTVLQGTLKDSPADTPAPVGIVELEGSGQYAGVKHTTPTWPMTYNFGTKTPSAEQLDKLKNLDPLDPGQSLYLLSDTEFESGGVLIRNSDGTWLSVWADGTVGHFTHSDEETENYIASTSYELHKAQWQAPAGPTTTNNLGTSGLSVTGWSATNTLPKPSEMGHVAASADLAGTPAGTWIFVPGLTEDTGLFLKFSEGYVGPGTNAAFSEWYPVKNGTVQGKEYPKLGQEAMYLPLDALDTMGKGIYVQGVQGGTIPHPDAPAATPTATTPTAPEPSGPQYPGAQLPSQENINAWGGAVTKDGHIPTPGMFVTGKGPMSGKIISVSKDKSKAVVLTSDGKKTTRLIEALKTDKTANYQAYAAPVTAKDIPQGMPLAVDTVAETLAKTPKDGKFRAILTAHPGVSHGAITVTKATGPSGKVYNRVHLTLTPTQRASLLASLQGAATIEKGDWVTSSKASENVAIGDSLPMRKSSTDNPDGTPRWKVDPAVTPPTHDVIGVVDEPGGAGIKIVTLKDRKTGAEITSRFHPGKSLTIYTWDANKIKPPKPQGAFALGDIAKADGWNYSSSEGGISAATGGAQDAQLKQEPGQSVSTGNSALGQIKHSWEVLRNVSADGVVIETVDPKGSPQPSSTGVTVISVPEGVDETALGAAFAKLGIDYSPMTQDSAKVHVRGMLRTLLSLDMSDVDTPKHYTDEMLFKQAGQTMGISDLGWQDVLVGVDESTGKTSYFWSDRARNALAGKAKYNLIYRAASSGNAAQIVSTVKYGSASSMMKKTTGMLDGSKSLGGGASAGTDNGNHAGHGSYASASTVGKLPSTNKQASYKGSPGMMVYHRPDAVLGRIMDYRVAGGDAFGKGQGSGSDHLKYATSMSSVTDYFLGGGLPTEAVGFIAVQDAGERTKAIAQLKADGYEMINGRPVEDIIITKQKAATLTPDDLPPVTIPANARPILDLPNSYDAPAVTASAEDEPADAAVDTAHNEEVA